MVTAGETLEVDDSARSARSEQLEVDELDSDPGSELCAGDLVGDYVVEERLGSGGFGTVYRARHVILGKAVAIKVLRGRRCEDLRAVARFVTEAKLAASLRHPNVVDVTTFGRLEDGRSFQVMELVVGHTLAERLRTHGPLQLDAALRLLRSIGHALDAVHDAGITHRDLKPANVMLHEADGVLVPKLIDFGVAKLVPPVALPDDQATIGLVGTPRYMAPEQCKGRSVDAKADVYAFGLLACEVLTGRSPFEGLDSLDWMLKHSTEAPTPPSRLAPGVPPGFDGVLLPLLEKRPHARPARLVPVVDQLERALEVARRRRRPLPSRGASALAVAGVVGVAMWSWRGGEQPAAPAPPPAHEAAAPNLPLPTSASPVARGVGPAATSSVRASVPAEVAPPSLHREESPPRVERAASTSRFVGARAGGVAPVAPSGSPPGLDEPENPYGTGAR